MGLPACLSVLFVFVAVQSAKSASFRLGNYDNERFTINGADYMNMVGRDMILKGTKADFEKGTIVIKFSGDTRHTIKVAKDVYINDKNVCTDHKNEQPTYRRTSDKTIWFTNCDIGDIVPENELPAIKKQSRIKDEGKKESRSQQENPQKVQEESKEALKKRQTEDKKKHRCNGWISYWYNKYRNWYR